MEGRTTTADVERITTDVRANLKSQYRAGLAMLRQAVDLCPEDAWLDDEPENACWQIAYHTLFFTHYYLQPTEHGFGTWKEHQADCQYPDGIPGPPDPKSDLPVGPRPYTKKQVLSYCDFCVENVDAWVDAIDVHSRESGFSWYRVTWSPDRR